MRRSTEALWRIFEIAVITAGGIFLLLVTWAVLK